MKIIDLAFQGPHEFQGLDEQYRSELEQSRAWSKALVVPETHPAKEVAEIVGLNDMDIVVVIDKHNYRVCCFRKSAFSRIAQPEPIFSDHA